MATGDTDNPGGPFLANVALRNYKSIAACNVPLPAFAALVGPNGSGKSNFLDALRFVRDALRNSLEYALRDRGGIGEVRRRSSGHPTHFSMRLDVHLPAEGARGLYAFTVGSAESGGSTVAEERCALWGGPRGQTAHYHVRDGALVKATAKVPAAIEKDRLYLGLVSGLPEFRPLYDALTHMGFYNLNPAAIRELQSPDPAQVLARDGRNLASILRQLEADNGWVKPRIEEYLAQVVPGVEGVDPKPIGPKETIEFRQKVCGAKHPWRFLAANMSDGTLRALGIIVALFQNASQRRKPVPLVGVEEPEAALHPAAISALADAIFEAAASTQVVITSHSPDLLDNGRIPAGSILAVTMEEGCTIIGPVDEAAREALRKGLYTPGELLRLQQIEPERPGQMRLAFFEDGLPE